MDELNNRLTENGHTPVKVRITVDFSRDMNDRLPQWPFQYAALDEALLLMRRSWWMCKIDMSRFFHQIPLALSVRKYFGFKWKGKSYMYNGLPFGVSLAPAVASLISAEVSFLLKSMGIPNTVYIDDIFITAPTQQQCQQLLEKAITIIASLGLKVNDVKGGRTLSTARIFGNSH